MAKRRIDEVAWGIPPEPDPGSRFRLKCQRPGPGGVLTFVCLSDRVIWCQTHWWGGRTKPCIGGPDSGQCPGCAAALPARWKGYAIGWQGAYFIAEFTPEARWSNPLLQESAAADLRGARITLSRHGMSPNGRVTARVDLLPVGRKPPSPPCDLLAQLENVWWGRRDQLRRRMCPWETVEVVQFGVPPPAPSEEILRRSANGEAGQPLKEV